MRRFTTTTTISLLLAAAVMLPSCNSSQSAKTVTLTTPQDKASYAIGVNLGNNFKTSYVEVNADAVARGIADVQAGNKLLLTETEMSAAMDSLQATAEKGYQVAIGENLKKASAFLAANATKEGVTTLADSLQYQIITKGTGPVPKAGDAVKVHYTGSFEDGKVFDSSVQRGEPAQFIVGQGQIIPGWDTILQMMPTGSKWKVFIPPSLAYGERGQQVIPPNSLLIFEVELIEIVPQTQK
jgi:FKBP-type peptidyl-prolyl cis-trans isomerase